LVVAKDLTEGVVVTIVEFTIDINDSIRKLLDSFTFGDVDADTSVGTVIRALWRLNFYGRDTSGDGPVSFTELVFVAGTRVKTVSGVRVRAPDAVETSSRGGGEAARAVGLVQACTGSWRWLNDGFTCNSLEVKRGLRSTFASSIDAVSVARTEGTIVVARRNGSRWDNTSVSFILRAFGVSCAFSLDERSVGVTSNSWIRAPRALDTNRVVDTSGTVDGRSSKVVLAGWGWRRGDTGV